MKTIHCDTFLKTLLSESIKLLKNNLRWLTSLSNKQRFCWGILTSCCTKISISAERLDWVSQYCSIFPNDPKLGEVFSTYRKKRLSGDKYIMTADLPKEIGKWVHIIMMERS